LGLIYMENNFTDWALGTYSYPVGGDTAVYPNIGCNIDRMGHVPKGVLGIRMDGVEDVVFTNLKINDLHEKSERGSDLCSEYWDEDFTSFRGMGHFIQNTPYLYGYTGNRVHGIMSDFSSYTFSGTVEISGIVSDTGLVRGIGMYTQTELTLDDGLTLTMRNFSAGHELYDEDTSAFAHPYAPSVAKPFHILWSYSDNFTIDTVENVVKYFNSSIVGEADTVSFSCIFGRDGMNDTDWDYTVENSDCSSMTMKLAVNEQIEKEDDARYPLLNARLNPLVLLSAVTVIVLLFVIYRSCWNRAKSKSKTLPTEYAPLLVVE